MTITSLFTAIAERIAPLGWEDAATGFHIGAEPFDPHQRPAQFDQPLSLGDPILSVGVSHFHAPINRSSER